MVLLILSMVPFFLLMYRMQSFNSRLGPMFIHVSQPVLS